MLNKYCLCTETLKKELAALNKAHAEGAHKLVDLIYKVRFLEAPINSAIAPLFSISRNCLHFLQGALHT